MTSKGLAIGIDLGTTYSCVGVWDNHSNSVHIIPNEFGHNTTPSYVSFTPTDRLIGDIAKSQASLNPKNTIFDAKRLIGRKANDLAIENDKKLWPFTVLSSAENKPMIQVNNYRGDDKQFSPEEISAFVLGKMKLIAEAYSGQSVESAVITVPAYFTDAQRQATKDAGQIAGLNVLRIINEPTAAAIAYGLQNSTSSAENQGKSSNILIFDLGGGTFDVSLLSVCDGIFEVKATAGDTHLGGEDFDQNLMNHFIEEISHNHGGVDIRKDEKSLRRLRTACERAKCALSSVENTNIELENIISGVDFHSSLSRAQFEKICQHSFDLTLQPVEQVLRDAAMDKMDINEVVLVGGSTRIPAIQRILSNYFNGKKLNCSINPDEAVAYGAAVQAALLTNNISPENAVARDLLLIDVTPLSLGLETAGGLMAKIINRNATIPTKAKQIFTTTEDNQESVEIHVFEGERVKTCDNNLLGTFELTNLPPFPRGKPYIEVMFQLDSNGILSVTAEEKSSGVSSKIVINNNKGRLSQEEINRMIAESYNYKLADEQCASLIHARSSLEQYVLQLRNIINEQKQAQQQLQEAEISQLEATIREICTFLSAEAHCQEFSKFEGKQREEEEKIAGIMSKLYPGNVPIFC
jgi:heat shock protein 1/8